MQKKFQSILVFSLLFSLVCFTTVKANPLSTKEIKLAENIKANITKLGTGKNAKVKVKLKDGTKLKGFVSQINADGFVVMNEKNNTTTEVAYKNAKQVKGNNLSTGVKIAIGVVIVFVVFAIIGLAQ